MSDSNPPQNPYGQPVAGAYGQQSAPVEHSAQAPQTAVWPGTTYGPGQGDGPGAPSFDPSGGAKRPGTVTAAAWVTIVLSALSSALFALAAMVFALRSDELVHELVRQPEFYEFRELNIDLHAATGLIAAMLLVLAVWALVSVVLAIFVLLRSNVARILLVISASVVALGSLLAILSGFSVVWLAGSIAVIVLLFVGGANDWFARRTPTSYQGGYRPGPPPYQQP